MPPPELKFLKTTAEQLWSNPTWDLILVFALLASGFFYGIMAGKRRIAATLLYTYIALALSSALPLGRWFGSQTSFAPSSEMDLFFMKAGAFLMIFSLLAFFLGSRRAKGMAPASAWWEIFILSFLQVGLLIHLVLGFLPQDKIKLLAPLTKNVFTNPDFHIWWLAAPVAILIFLRRLESREE